MDKKKASEEFEKNLGREVKSFLKKEIENLENIPAIQDIIFSLQCAFSEEKIWKLESKNFFFLYLFKYINLCVIPIYTTKDTMLNLSVPAKYL